MQYTQSHAWGFVQENHHQQQQQQQQNHQLRPLTSCYKPSPKFMSPPPYMEYLQEHQQFQKNRNTPTQLLPQQNYHPAPHQSPFPTNLNGTGNEVQETENLGINYVYSNSGKTFQYGVMPTSTSGNNSRGFTQQSNRQHQQYTSSTTNILTTTMNRSTYLNDSEEIIKRDYYFAMVTTMRGGYCGALQRQPPPIPAALNRRLINRGQGNNVGKIKVMLRMTDNGNGAATDNEFISIDQKKRQITFIEPSSSSAAENNANAAAGPSSSSSAAAQVLDRAPMVSAPKIFAFDGMFTNADPQNDVCTAALQDVIPAVLDGIDGCVLALGHPKSGQSRSMFGSMASAGDLGIIPCAISWLYKGIAEHREKGSRFSVRMSALAVSATKSAGSKAHDLLATMASESDDSPGMYFNVGGPVELRAPTMERAALYLDMALSQISNHAYAPATVFTLHVYQYNLEQQGKLSGGRSRLHLISLGDAANAKGGLPLSGVGNVLLAVLSGQKHVPYKSHPLTVILRECLASFSSNISVITHLSYAQNRTDALTIIQLSSRIHRIRRKKNKYHTARGGALQLNPNPGNVGSSSSGLEPSSSEMSADTVIYLGPCNNEETDGEHPPVILPNLSYKGNQCTVDMPENYPRQPQQPHTPRRNLVASNSSGTPGSPRTVAAVKPEKSFQPPPPTQLPSTSSMIVHGRQRMTEGAVHKSSSSHASPHHQNYGAHQQQQSHSQIHHRSAPRGMIHADNIVMEQWVDGPKVARSKISEARHLKREVNRNHNSETWIDGPKVEPAPVETKVVTTPVKAMPSLVSSKQQRAYGFMDTHKKSMIRKWVENQTTEVLKISSTNGAGAGNAQEWEQTNEGVSLRRGSCSRGGGSGTNKTPSPDEDDQDSGPSDVPPALPLIDKSSSKNSEKDYGYTMNDYAAQQTLESGGNDPMTGHPLSALSYGNMSTVSSFHHFEEVRIQSGDQRRSTNDKNMDQLARIRELFTSQLALAEVNRVFHFCTNDNNSIYSEPVHKLLDGNDLDSACSEPIMFNQNSHRDVIPNQPQRPTELVNKLETSTAALAMMATMAGSMNLQDLSGATGGGGVSGAVSNLQDLDLEYPFVDHQQQQQLNHPGSSSMSRGFMLNAEIQEELARIIPQQPPPIVTEPYDSGHDSTPRTSKHSGFSRRAESGYHSISVTVHDESEVSSLKSTTVSTRQAAKRDRRLLCLWLRNPFNCTAQPETEAEISDF